MPRRRQATSGSELARWRPQGYDFPLSLSGRGLRRRPEQGEGVLVAAPTGRARQRWEFRRAHLAWPGAQDLLHHPHQGTEQPEYLDLSGPALGRWWNC